MPNYDFHKVANKVALLCNFIEITLRHGCSPGSLMHIFRTLCLKNTFRWLLLSLDISIWKTEIRFIHYKLPYIAVNNRILGCCFHYGQTEDLSFTTSIAGVQKNVSCTDDCNCNGTTNKYSAVNCPSCCCQKRVTCRGTNHSKFK